MQYLSKAYQYYSGINPATLTGAIDVIVVKRKDEHGETIYSCSPFHVRFGKLRVLRAGEKRVTLTLPENIPGPSHEAPFWMKVGEAGEAFFVVETDEEVPEELQTSPVMNATEVDDQEAMGRPMSPPPDLGSSTDVEADEDERFVGKKTPLIRRTSVQEPTFLDLNAQSQSQQTPASSSRQARDDKTPRAKSAALQVDAEAQAEDAKDETSGDAQPSSVSPSSLLSSATSLLPSFLSPSSSNTSQEELASDKRDKKGSGSSQRPPSPPPNPLKRYEGSPQSSHGRSTGKIKDYVDQNRPEDQAVDDDAASTFSVGSFGNSVDSKLPRLKKGEGDEPDVLYTDDAVIDMSGYHQRNPTTAASPTRSQPDSDMGQHPDVIRFAEDLIASAGSQSKSVSALMRQDTLEACVDVPSPAAKAKDKIEAEIHSLAQAIEGLPTPSQSASSRLRAGFVRAGSEPPHLSDDGSQVLALDSPPLAPQEPGSPDYTWEWGQLPIKTPAAIEHPPFELDLISGDAAAMKTPKNRVHHLSSLDSDRERARSNSMPDVADALLEPERPSNLRAISDPAQSAASDQTNGRLKNDEEDAFKFILDVKGTLHTFELGLIEEFEMLKEDEQKTRFAKGRVTFRKFIEDPEIVQRPDLVVRYKEHYLTWFTAGSTLAALAIYRRSLQPPLQSPTTSTLPSLTELGINPANVQPRTSKGYSWSRWWRRGESAGDLVDAPSAKPVEPPAPGPAPVVPASEPTVPTNAEGKEKYYAKTLRLTSDQLKSLKLKDGPNPITFSVTSSYSGVATCTARIFLWDESNAVVISDIDGTITKSDALGHVFAALGRDWTHLGVAKLYTDVCNNGYKIMYLTSRAIGQADSTRYYLRGIHQGNYQLPDGPVIMSPDRLFTSLHREVIMRKPELFKMACLRDIQRLFGAGNRKPFYAGFGNRITDAMSYRSVNIPSSRIFTIDSGGEVKMELLELAGYKSSYIHMTDLVDQMFPPVQRSVIPEYTDFNYWRPSIPDIPLPDLTPVSPALSATSDSSGRLSMLRNIATLGRRTSRATSLDGSQPAPNISQQQQQRPTSPLVGPSIVAEPDEAATDDISDHEDMWNERDREPSGSMPGSFDQEEHYLNDEFFDRTPDRPKRRSGTNGSGEQDDDDEDDDEEEDEDGFYDEDGEYPEMFDDDLLATGEMQKVPYM